VQAREVAKVKRSANGVITDPVTLGPDDTVGTARELMREHHVSGFPVTETAADVRDATAHGARGQGARHPDPARPQVRRRSGLARSSAT
jgi:CBS domain-containing protein